MGSKRQKTSRRAMLPACAGAIVLIAAPLAAAAGEITMQVIEGERPDLLIRQIQLPEPARAEAVRAPVAGERSAESNGRDGRQVAAEAKAEAMERGARGLDQAREHREAGLARAREQRGAGLERAREQREAGAERARDNRDRALERARERGGRGPNDLPDRP